MDQIKDEEILKFPPRQQEAEKANEQTEGEARLFPYSTGDVEMQKASFQPLDQTTEPGAGDRDKKLDLIMGINLSVSVELGRTNIEIRRILDMKRGSIIEFDRMAGEPVDIIVNGTKMAEGEVVVIDKHFAIRVTSLVGTAERIKGLGS
ncbi:MAG: flagellar motor switch protein FliN [Bacteroidetes bacterium]|nr:flagellar motor switch protein FliN [Bacteroidota bacterium]MCW5895103.1 flagellar motor switch protein FliN [Bacteroidota bacterium]